MPERSIKMGEKPEYWGMLWETQVGGEPWTLQWYMLHCKVESCTWQREFCKNFVKKED